MITCPECGNKRCPKATSHGNECTGSNAPNQPGSAYQICCCDWAGVVDRFTENPSTISPWCTVHNEGEAPMTTSPLDEIQEHFEIADRAQDANAENKGSVTRALVRSVRSTMDVPKLVEVVRAVEKLHWRRFHNNKPSTCHEDGKHWPCPTRQAIGELP